MNPSDIAIPVELLPTDGRFGSGPSKVRLEALTALTNIAPTYMGTSHRQAPVKNVVGALRQGLRDMFGVPDHYEVVLGNGGTTVFWDALTFGFVKRKSQHLSFGEFSSKFAAETRGAPFLEAPEILESDYGTHPYAIARHDIDTYALTHNETSTGVMMPIERPAGAHGLVVVDATSAAGGLRVDLTETDCYYLAPQKALSSDGGLWIAFMSPAALERAREVAATDRWIPKSISLTEAIDNSTKNQTYNTPSLATLHLTLSQVEWINSQGGLEWAASRCDESSAIIYEWAERTSYTTPFVARPDERSHTVATIDLDETVKEGDVCDALRANGIVDVFSYRKLGRNQLRIAMFPAIEPEDLARLTRCIDFVVEALKQ
jgi:phosphoserine aminotransferase